MLRSTPLTKPFRAKKPFFAASFTASLTTAESAEETAKVEESQEILSICKNDSHVAMTVESSDVLQPYTLKLYSLSGKEIFQENFDFSYENMEMDEDQILLWNRGEFAIYNFSGVEKFNGSVEEGQIQEIIGLGNRNYLGVLDQGLLYMKLR